MKKEVEKGAALLSLYRLLYKEKYGKQPTGINIYRDKWKMVDVIDTLGFDESKRVLQYYFTTVRPDHGLDFFMYNFDKLDEEISKQQEDDAYRKRVIAESRKRVEEWRKREQ